MAFCILSPFAMFAQFTLSGVIKDTLNNPIYGAVVKIENTYQGAYTDPDGRYAITNLKGGSYNITVEALGLKTVKQTVVIETSNKEVDFVLIGSPQQLAAVAIEATRVKNNSPIAHTNVEKKDYEKINLGQDIAYLLQTQPSLVTTSDAGAGVGYTGIRIRGSDASRINVTINGIPLNDPESHGVFWVNMPDFASSVENIQIQRGVGSSTNGAGAFGATINLQTDIVSDSAYAELSSSYGSFNTNKNTIRLGTGLINKKWAVDGRLSNITSDGYVDRATADLNSYFLQAGYYGEKTVIRAVTFAGGERTYQSWWGTPEALVNGDKAGLLQSIANNGFTGQDSARLVNSDRTYNFYTYDNEVDNYNQDHYQLHFTHQFSSNLTLNAAAHYTYGRGYFEQFRGGDALSSYGLDDVVLGGDTVKNGDFIRRRWLDNHFYGGVFSLNYKAKAAEFTLGGGANQYDGDHFGELIWAEFASNSEIRDRYYDNSSLKTDANLYLKADFLLAENLTGFMDMQVRTIDYTSKGIDNGNIMLDVDTVFYFFNPKVGVNYDVDDKTRAYASISVANREPTRNDFIDNPRNAQPTNETLIDYEVGVEHKGVKFYGLANFYFMDYQNQLVVTGALNDVGASIRTNVKESYRMGIELLAGVKVNKRFEWNVNATFSQNKILDFTEFIGDTSIFYSSTDIALSPNIVAASVLTYIPIKGLEASLQTKYVGRQYLDNSGSEDRDLPAYITSDLIVSYNTSFMDIKNIQFNLLINNLFNEMYSNNGYTYGWFAGNDRVSENWIYPQAGTNVLAGVTLKF